MEIIQLIYYCLPVLFIKSVISKVVHNACVRKYCVEPSAIPIRLEVGGIPSKVTDLSAKSLVISPIKNLYYRISLKLPLEPNIQLIISRQNVLICIWLPNIDRISSQGIVLRTKHINPDIIMKSPRILFCNQRSRWRSREFKLNVRRTTKLE
jgi:hypothetical protein